jgi:predicted nucleic acid-binding protein
VYLVDTNVLSELARAEPRPGVLEWASAVRSEAFIDEHCEVVPVTAEIARRAGQLRGDLQARGASRTQADMLIAATAQEHDLILVTRNTRDFDGCALRLLDPF